jgi:hypothetical protein
MPAIGRTSVAQSAARSVRTDHAKRSCRNVRTRLVHGVCMACAPMHASQLEPAPRPGSARSCAADVTIASRSPHSERPPETFDGQIIKRHGLGSRRAPGRRAGAAPSFQSHLARGWRGCAPGARKLNKRSSFSVGGPQAISPQCWPVARERAILRGFALRRALFEGGRSRIHAEARPGRALGAAVTMRVPAAFRLLICAIGLIQVTGSLADVACVDVRAAADVTSAAAVPGEERAVCVVDDASRCALPRATSRCYANKFHLFMLVPGWGWSDGNRNAQGSEESFSAGRNRARTSSSAHCTQFRAAFI